MRLYRPTWTDKSGRRGLEMANLEALAELLGLRIVADKPKRRKGR